MRLRCGKLQAIYEIEMWKVTSNIWDWDVESSKQYMRLRCGKLQAIYEIEMWKVTSNIWDWDVESYK